MNMLEQMSEMAKVRADPEKAEKVLARFANDPVCKDMPESVKALLVDYIVLRDEVVAGLLRAAVNGNFPNDPVFGLKIMRLGSIYHAISEVMK